MSRSRKPKQSRHEHADDPTEEPVLPQVSSDERAVGWGDDPSDSRRDDEWYRRERPPHHE